MRTTTPVTPGSALASGHSPVLPKIWRKSLFWPFGPMGPAPLRAGGAAPCGPSPGVNACTKSDICIPAFPMSFWMRSMATRTFCCRSLSSGSRRKAAFPPDSRPKMAPLTIRVTSMAMVSSTRLNPDGVWLDSAFMTLLSKLRGFMRGVRTDSPRRCRSGTW